MGLFLFSLVVSIILGGSLWLLVGDRLPLGEGQKWESRTQVLAYSGVMMVLTCLTVFLLGI